MNIIAALKSGRPFRHKDWCSEDYYLGPLNLTEKINLFQTTWQELISDDWEIKEPTVTITAIQFWDAFRACPVGGDVVHFMARRLGLESK